MVDRTLKITKCHKIFNLRDLNFTYIQSLAVEECLLSRIEMFQQLAGLQTLKFVVARMLVDQNFLLA